MLLLITVRAVFYYDAFANKYATCLGIIVLILVLLSTTYLAMNIALLNFTWSWQLVVINKAGDCKLIQKTVSVLWCV